MTRFQSYALAAFGFLLINTQSHAQGSFTFAAPTDGAGTATSEVGRSICSDANGNVYIVGVFNSGGGLTDFDLNSASTSTFSSAASTNDGYVAAYDKNGNFLWKTIITGTLGDFTAPAGGICTNGTFVWVAGDVTMGGSPQIMSSTNTVTITSPGSGTDAFVAKLACGNGSVQWEQAFGGTGALDFAEGICCDPNGCCYVTGAYSTAFTLGSINAPTPNGTSDFFIAKFGVGGNMIRFNSGGALTSPDMIGNGGGLCYVPGATPAIVATGHTGSSNATFGTFTNIPNQGGNDAILIELDTVLTYTNVLGIGSNGADELLSAFYDPFSGGVFVCGYNTASAPMSFPSYPSAVTTLNNLGGQDIMIARYSVSTNNIVWAHDAGGSLNDRGWAITADGQGGIQMAGFTLSAPCTFSGSVVINANAGNADLYVVRYDPNGTPAWVLTAASGTTEEARGITSYVQNTPYSQSLFITGVYSGTVSMGSTSLNCDGGNDFFLAKINDANLPLSATQSQVNLTCNGVCNGSATVVTSGGTPPYTYSWSPSGGSGATASILCATNYTVTITDANSNSITKTFSITQPPAIISSVVSQTNISCNGGSNGAATITAGGGTGSLTYNWTPGNPTGDGTVSVSGLTTTTWSCTITDANTCTRTQTVSITQPSAIVVSPVSQTNISCNGGSNGAASVLVSGGTPGYSYNWFPGNPSGDGTASVTGLTQGTWTCNVTDANGCINSATFSITQPSSPVSGTTVVTNVSCFGGSNGAIDLTPTGGTPGYTYNWLPSGPTTQDRTGLVAGTYSVQITDVNGCVGTVTATVTQPTSPVSGTTVVTNVSCFGGSNGAIDLTPTGGTPGYTYNWLPSGPTTQDRTGLVAGTYSVQITDVNGCVGTVTTTVTQPTSPVSGTTVVTNVSCFGGSNGAINLTPNGGSGGYTFNWLPSGPTTEDRTGLTPGTYSVQITDVNGCVGTVTATVTQPTSPVSGTTVVTNVACFGGSNGAINLTPTGGSGGYTFNWLPSGPTTEDRTGLVAGTYSVQITDVNGCVGTVTATVTQPTSPVSGTTVVTNISCFGGSNGAIDLTPTGGTPGYTYNWLPSGPTTQDRTGLVAGTYSVQITDVNGCVGTVTATVTQPTSPVSGTTVVTNVSCFGGSNGAINLTPTGGSGGYTFNWLPSGPTTEDRTGLVAGTYSVQITDVNGCVGTVTATVTQPTSPVSGTTVVTNVACFGGSNGAIDLTPTGGTPGYTYNWLPSGPTTQDRTGLTAGTYSVIITDANGCTGTVTTTVTQPTSPVSGTTVVTNVACFGGSNGAIDLTPTGGTPGYTYNWLPSGPTTQDRTGLTAGTYSVIITDANGCTGTVTTTVTQPTSPVSGTTVVTNVSCFGGSNGAINLTPTGGSGGYTFNWLPSGPTTEDRTGLTAGTYSVIITDANGCTGTVTASVTQPPALVATSSSTSILCNGGNSTITVAASGGTTAYTGTGTFTVIAGGPYSYTVTDANGCTSTTTITVTEPTALVATSSATAILCNGGNSTVTVAATGGTSAYTGTGTFTVAAGGPYSYTVTDANGCTSTTTITVTEPAALVATSSATAILCNGGNSTVTVAATGGTSAYTGTGTFTVAAGGPYSYTVTDANGCTSTTTITVTEPTAINVTETHVDVSCNGGNNGSIDLTVTGGTSPYTFDWNSGMYTTEDLTGLTAGTYSGTLTDANGCTASGTISITEPTLLVTTSSATSILCNSGNSTVTVVASGGTTPYSGDGTFIVTAGGPYSYTVTDANGCTSTTTITVTEPAALVATSSATSILCNGGNSTVTVVASGGTTPYSGDGTFTVTAGGPYSYTVTDGNGCTSTTTITLTEPSSISVSSTTVNVSCFGGNDGSIDLTVTGGTAPYTFDWNSGTYTTEDLTGLTAGTYSGTLTDANGCTDSGTMAITEPAVLAAIVTTATNPSSCGSSTGSIDITVSGGTTAYTFVWSNSATSEDISSLNAGSYSCNITDANGCTTTVSSILNDPNAPVVTVSLPIDTACSDMPGSITLGGESPAGGTWSGTGVSGNMFDAFSNSLAQGQCLISYTYTDVNGCTGSSTDTMFAELCMGIVQPVAMNNDWQLYPNPTSGQFTLNLAEALNGTISVEVFAADGRLVYSSVYTMNNTVPKITVDLSNNAVGVYFVKIKHDDSIQVIKAIRE